MGRSGVWLVRRRPGESDQAAIDRTTAGWIEIRNGVPWMVPNESAEAAAPDDGFILAATAVARSINERLEVTEERSEDGQMMSVTLDDGDGPVVVSVYPGEAQLTPPRGWSDPPGADGAGFHSMWSYATAIAEAFDCVTYDPDYGEVVDLSLDEGEAREIYGWL